MSCVWRGTLTPPLAPPSAVYRAPVLRQLLKSMINHTTEIHQIFLQNIASPLMSVADCFSENIHHFPFSSFPSLSLHPPSLPLPPLSFHSTSCVPDPSGSPQCHCLPGHTGPLCDSCSDGFFGQPPAFPCSQCTCSGNIDPATPGSCDMTTGQCLLCINNSTGPQCETCDSGFFGDATQQDCQRECLWCHTWNLLSVCIL